MNVKSIFLPPKKTKNWLIYLFVIGLLTFLLFSLLSFAAYFVARYGFSFKTLEYTGLSKLRFFNIPVFVLESYNSWILAFEKSLNADKFSKLLLIPLLAPAFTFFVVSSLIRRKPKNNLAEKYFATFEDVQDLNIFGASSMVLGRLNNYLLKPKKTTSSLVWFSEGLGKTASIAIPSILEADKVNVVAVDCTGTLARFTSGYRSQVSHVFNFNWDKVDDVEKGEYFPRWNPLSSGNMPRKHKAREAYIKSISQYLIIKDPNNYWERMASSTLEAILHFFVSKIEQASANDYFLSRLFESNKLSTDDRELLSEYYQFMPEDLSEEALENLKAGSLTIDNYLPVGSWYKIPELWQGKEVCFAMVVDTLLYIYCDSDMENNEEVAIWKNMLLEFLKEAQLFGYNPKYLSVFDSLTHLTIRQRRVVFTLILDALSAFRKMSIRERTSLSDFNLSNIRGIVDEETGEQQLVTVYSSVLSKASSFMTVMLVDMLLGANINLKSSQKENSLFFIFDDFEILPKFKLLNEAMGLVNENNMSFMILTRDLDGVAQIYDKETLEEILLKTEYKLFSDENNLGMSNKLKAVGGYVSQSAAVSSSNVFSRPLLRGDLYNNVSKDLLSPKVETLTKGKYLLFADVFYGRPIKVGSIFFAKNPSLRSKASIEEVSSIEEVFFEKRNVQDVEVPDIIDVIRQTDVDIKSEKDIQNYILKQKDIASENIAKMKSSSGGTENSVHTQTHETKEKLKNKNIKVMEKEDNWWLDENAFSNSNNKISNPFGN